MGGAFLTAAMAVFAGLRVAPVEPQVVGIGKPEIEHCCFEGFGGIRQGGEFFDPGGRKHASGSRESTKARPTTDIGAGWPRIPRAFCVFYDASTLIVICAKPMGPFVSADCWLAAENLMLAASALGLGTCCIGSAIPALNSPEAKPRAGDPCRRRSRRADYRRRSEHTRRSSHTPPPWHAPGRWRDPQVLYWK